MIFAKLDAEQSEAVRSIEGPVLVFAGAGSGKTRTISYRTKYMIDHKQVAPENILCVTFTNKAAGEMRGRITAILDKPADGQNMQISTFHSLGRKILKENGFHDYKIITQQEQINIVNFLLNQYEINSIETNHVIHLFSKIKASHDYIFHNRISSNIIRSQNVIKIFEQYNNILSSKKMLDFDDLLAKPVFIFSNDANVLKEYQDKYKFIMVDEYQDTNYAQFMLSKQIAEHHRNIMVVGDDNQAIYEWRGADYTNILNFHKHFENTRIIYLNTTYRCPANIVKVANKVINMTSYNKSKNLKPFRKKMGSITKKQLPQDEEEAKYVADKVCELVFNQGYDFADIGILYRNNSLSYHLEKIFLKRKLPYEVKGIPYFKRKEVTDVLALINILEYDWDIFSLENILKFIPFIGYKHAHFITQQIRDKQSEEVNSCQVFFDNIDAYTFVSEKGTQYVHLLKDFYYYIKNMKEQDSISPQAIIKECVTFYKKNHVDRVTMDAETYYEKINNIEALVHFASGYKNTKMLMDDIATETNDIYDVIPNESDKIQMMTIHAAKGLEFKVVFIVGMDDGIFPSALSKNIDEERRLLYVALTRAIEKVIATTATNRVIKTYSLKYRPSRFFGEI